MQFSEPINLQTIIITDHVSRVTLYSRVVVNDLHRTHPVWAVVPGDLLEASLHGLVLEQGHAAHQVPHQDEVAAGLHEERDDVVEVGALEVERLLLGPLPQPHRAVDARQQLAVEGLDCVGRALDLLLRNLQQIKLRRKYFLEKKPKFQYSTKS